jgi:16S rRNA A1518/A1519 N6-dimethyltransferase RsmA/KsgA/DIM1 with predicted DNA glycosylase/AP lyase activity
MFFAPIATEVRTTCPYCGVGCGVVAGPGATGQSHAATLPWRGRVGSPSGDPGWGDSDAAFAEALSPPPGPLKRADLPPAEPRYSEGSATQQSDRSRQQPTSVGGGGRRHAERDRPGLPGGGTNNGVRIVANLPYNIATALLVRWLSIEPWPPWYDSLVLMFQREVAERIVAAPGAKQYGRLAVLAGWRTEAKIMFDVGPSAFVPPPKVTSSVVRLAPRARPLACSRTTLERVAAAAFGQRRKMLRQSLRALGADPLPILAAARIDPAARAEEISVEGFVALANAVDSIGV